MSDPFIGQIQPFACNFAIRNWAFCNGQLLAIAQNTALFSLLGTIYGGDGRTTFGLPNLQGQLAMHPGTGPGLTPRRIGERGGEETVTLQPNQLGAHDHRLQATALDANSTDPAGRLLATTPVDYYGDGPAQQAQAMAGQTMGNAGGGGAHENRQPYQAVGFQIALVGVYPSRP